MKIIRGKIKKPQKVVVYGPEGVGKSTFAAQFPEPLFIDTEGSTEHMDVPRFESPSSWTMMLEQIDYTIRNPHICKTLVIDTADWAEAMCIQGILDADGTKSLADYDYGRGYIKNEEEFGRFLNMLTRVTDKGVGVVVTAHSQIKAFIQPDEMGAYDRYELKLEKKTSALLKEWADMLLFANYKTEVFTDGKTKKTKAMGGKRVMYTEHRPNWDAKNRHGLKPELDFSYDAIKDAVAFDEHSTSTKAIIPEDQAPSKNTTVEVVSTIYPPLADLMIAGGITKEQLSAAIGPSASGGLGYFPSFMKIEELPEDFAKHIVSQWKEEFLPQAQQIEDLPFDLS